jgi:DNA-binding IclR family transcriptional regulator
LRRIIFCQQLHIPQSTVYRYVRVLSDHGFIEKSGSRSYRLGLAFLELGRTALNSNRDLKLRALPAMERIARACGESVSLIRRFNDRVICIENIEGRYALRVAMEPGRTQPFYAGALPNCCWLICRQRSRRSSCNCRWNA